MHTPPIQPPIPVIAGDRGEAGQARRSESARDPDGKTVPSATGSTGNPLPPPGGPGEQLRQTVVELNRHVQQVRRDLRFEIDESTGRPIIKVLDSESQEVIRQIPPEEALAVAHRMQTGEDGGLLEVTV